MVKRGPCIRPQASEGEAGSMGGYPSSYPAFPLARQQVGPRRYPGRARLFRRLAGPPFERMIECAAFLVAQEPCYFGNRQVWLCEVAIGQIASQAVQNAGERGSLGS